MTADAPHRAGTVAILGPPNVGKSTLLNQMVGEKLAIVTPKPQTTRNRIVGVWNGPDAQVVFVDTPGLHAARSELGRFMVSESLAALDEVDAALLVVDASDAGPAAAPRAAARSDRGERLALERLREAGKPVVLAPNKVDLLRDKSRLLPFIDRLSGELAFTAVVPISALDGDGVDRLVGEVVKLLPEGPPLFAPETLTDRTERFLASELIREQVFLSLHQEVPYGVAVAIDEWEEREKQGRPEVVIAASILVERESQKGIVVGKGGAMIRDLGTRARHEITRLLGRPAHLKLHVKVSPDWSTTPQGLSRAGYQR